MLQEIIKDTGLNITRYESVSGGDINSAFCLYDTSKKYFLKTNSASAYKNMFVKEAKGLNALSENCSLQIPKVIKHNVVGDKQYLLLEWVERGSPSKNFWEDFGAALALLHKRPQTYFGFEENNFIGSAVQNNSKKGSWPEFYSENRILPLAKQIYKGSDLILVEKFCAKLNALFPMENPSLLHGDLWSGNFICASNGKASIFDPAVYYGHREMDLGMTKLFGGFDKKFYESYNAAYPLEKDWEKRLPLSQLYPLLVHAVLFGGSYSVSALNIIKNYS